MIHPRVVALAAAAIVALSAGAPRAQEALPDIAQGEQHPPLADEAPQTPAERLDALFASLGDADPTDAARLERQILDLWSRSGSDSMDFLLRRGRESLDAEEYDKSVAHLSALIDLAPEFAEAWNMRATAHFMAKDYWASMADIQRTLALEPRHFGALVGLATILEQTGDSAGALRAHRAALALHPSLEPATRAVERLAAEVDGRDI
ncbi:MAG: hypothetical protein ACFCUS_09535 [Rubrimonas sp.]|uniref:hypothetical protein n=1 Tax=Rubrimonas sp. TaxID=2036015 RepID=UPI002FDEFA69